MIGEAALSHDELLARLLAEASEQQRQGRPVDVESLARQHPDLVDELRQLLAVVQLADELGPRAASSQATLPPSSPDGTRHALQRSFGDFEILEEIGRGGMGVVYKAWEKSLKRHVALKMILGGAHASGVDLVRFRSEAQSAAGLNHPNIVPVYKVGEQDGQAYFSMKYVAGSTLAECVKQGPLPPRQAARLLAAVSRAVQHAHQNGILHRDLKPANILLQAADGTASAPAQPASFDLRTAVPLVTDFGLAKRVEGSLNLTGTGAIVGTPSYMAPEQAAGTGTPAPAGDIYSLGAILYEALTGRPPFLATSAVATLLLVRSEEPIRPRQLNPQIDPDLEFICRKCLEKKPEHRYATAAQLADDLEAYLRDDAVSARVSTLSYFLSRIFRESHHAPVLENWGGLFMLHSLKIFLLCAVTSIMYALGVRSHEPFLALWSIGLVVWGTFFWYWRRRAGPVAFVERQLAHSWAAGVIASIGAFVVEVCLGLEVLVLTPILAVAAGMVFLFMAGTLSGWFYVVAAISFLAAVPMAYVGPPASPFLFGIICAIAFFVPGLKYFRRRKRS
jgi:eukaryotic-like serine/threonine-protein kinase